MHSEAVTLKMSIVDAANSEVDISTKYFSSQMMSFVTKGTKIMSIRVALAQSPGAFGNTALPTSKERISSNEIFQSRRCLNMQQNESIIGNNNITAHPHTTTTSISIINTTPKSSPKRQGSPPVVFPLERYANKQAKIVQRKRKLKTFS